MQIPIKILASFLAEIDRLILNFIRKGKAFRKSKIILKKKYKDRRLTVPDSKIYYKTRVIKIVCYWLKDRHTDQRKRTEPGNRPA